MVTVCSRRRAGCSVICIIKNINVVLSKVFSLLTHHDTPPHTCYALPYFYFCAPLNHKWSSFLLCVGVKLIPVTLDKVTWRELKFQNELRCLKRSWSGAQEVIRPDGHSHFSSDSCFYWCRQTHNTADVILSETFKTLVLITDIYTQ